MFASGWKNTRISPTPASDCDSMCSMLLTVVVIARSEIVTMRPSTSFGESPVYCQMTETTGMLIAGKMSTGVRAIVRTPPMAISIAITMKVYGRRSARRTIHIVVADRNQRAAASWGIGSRPPAGTLGQGAAVCRSAGMSAERSAGASGSVTGPGSRLAPASNARRPGTELAS